MRKIGDWVWYYDEYKNRYIAQIIGFESDKRLRLIVYPENVGQLKVMFRYPDEIGYPTVSELSDETEEDKMATQSRAYTDGYEFAKSLMGVFGNSNITDANAVFNLGERYAKMSGYTALQDGIQFVKGFVVAFQSSQVKQIRTVEENPK